MSEPIKHNANIRGAPLDLETLKDLATVDTEDLQTASLWFDENASIEWVGALDSEPIRGTDG